MTEREAFQALYDLLAQLESEQPKRFQTLRVKTAVNRLEELYAEGMTTIEALRANVADSRAERDDYIARFEREQHEHETTKGYRAHAEAQLADCQRAVLLRMADDE